MQILNRLRRREIAPRLPGIEAGGTYRVLGPEALRVEWRLGYLSQAELDRARGPARDLLAVDLLDTFKNHPVDGLTHKHDVALVTSIVAKY